MLRLVPEHAHIATTLVPRCKLVCTTPGLRDGPSLAVADANSVVARDLITRSYRPA
jgi:hypothetical protein